MIGKDKIGTGHNKGEDTGEQVLGTSGSWEISFGDNGHAREKDDTAGDLSCIGKHGIPKKEDSLCIDEEKRRKKEGMAALNRIQTKK